jgi:hypothetical protein
MIKASNEEWGTVAGLAALTKELNDAAIDGESLLGSFFILTCFY